MIILRVPAVVDESVLQLAMETADKCGTEIRLETFFRIRADSQCSIDCDTEKEVRDYGRLAFGSSLKSADVKPLQTETVAAADPQ